MPTTAEEHHQETCSAADWMAIIETQQQEIQTLRQALALGSALEGYPVGADEVNGSAFNSPSKRPLTPLSSTGSELLTTRYEDALVDAERYKAMCEKMQRVRSKLVKRDVQVRRARAQILAVQEEAKRYQQAAAQLQIRVSELCMNLQRESTLKEEAIEKAAQSLMQCDRLGDELASQKVLEKALKAELQAHQERTQQVESSANNLHQDKAHLVQEVAMLANDNAETQRELLLLQSSVLAEQVQVAQCEQLLEQNRELKERVPALDRVVQLQTDQMQKQQQSLMELEIERAQQSIESQRERDDNKRHAVHLLQANIKLQLQVDTAVKRELCMKQRAQELQEANAMVAEELELKRLKDKHRQQQLRKYDDDYKLLLSSYRERVKASSNMELSRRDLMAALAQSKKKVAVLQSALETLDSEIQNLSKAVASNRNRCVLSESASSIERC